MKINNKLSAWLESKQQGQHHRQFISLDLAASEINQVCHVIANYYNDIQVVEPESSNIIRDLKGATYTLFSTYKKLLGSQYDVVIYDASKGLDLNVWCACIGAVSNGGLFVFCYSSNINNKHNPSLIKFSHGYSPDTSYFWHLLLKQLNHEKFAIIDKNNTYLPTSKTKCVGQIQNEYLLSNERETVPIQNTDSRGTQNKVLTEYLSTAKKIVDLSITQETIIESIVSQLENKKFKQKFLSIILGERGRGKSSLLGQISAYFLCKKYLSHSLNDTADYTGATDTSLLKQENDWHIYATSNSKSHISACIDMCNTIVNQCKPNTELPQMSSSIQYYAPDELLNSLVLPHQKANDQNTLLIIDEVASLAPDIVKKLVKQFNYIILVGTTTGYEGSGMGFVKRLLPYLVKHYDCNQYTLRTPFRWLPYDPIETFSEKILCKAQTETASILTSNDHTGGLNSSDTNATSNISSLTSKMMLDSFTLYQQVFALLQEAHYQTTPNDILRILDSPDCKIIAAFSKPLCIDKKSKEPQFDSSNHLLGIMVLFVEGGEQLSDIKTQICHGIRRVQGHLSPQSLSMHSLDETFCDLRYWRISRIAVNSSCQNQGVGSKLLAYCHKLAETNDIDFLSVSYGITKVLYHFWVKNNFILVKLGHRIDTSSGVPSVLMLNYVNRNNMALTQHIMPLQKRLEIDYRYYKQYWPALNGVYQFIFTKCTTNLNDENIHNKMTIDETTQILIDKFIGAFKIDLIDFNKCKSIIHHLMLLKKHTDPTKYLDSHNPIGCLPTLFDELHVKGLHKHERQVKEQQIRLLVTNLNSG